MKALLAKRAGTPIVVNKRRPPANTHTITLDDSGVDLVQDVHNTSTKFKELEEEKLKTASLLQEVESQRREIKGMQKEIDDLTLKLEHAVRGRPSSGDLSSGTVLDLIGKELEGCSIVSTDKLNTLLANICTCENIESLKKEAADAEAKLLDLYGTLD